MISGERQSATWFAPAFQNVWPWRSPGTGRALFSTDTTSYLKMTYKRPWRKPTPT